MTKSSIPEQDGSRPDNIRELTGAFRRGWLPKVRLALPPSKDMAPALLCGAIVALRENLPLDRMTRLYLADALADALENPAKAAHALGINRPRGRETIKPSRTALKLAMGVHVLHKMGFALPPSKKDRGALQRVSEVFHCSVDTVERAWDANKNFLRLQDAIEASEADPLTDRNRELLPPD